MPPTSAGEGLGYPFLVGSRVYLRALCDQDAEGPYPQWFNDAEVCRGSSHHVFPYSQGDALDYIRRVRSSRESLVLAIVLGEGHRHIGNIALQSIHPVYRSAEFAVVLGERACWGQGYAREAGNLLLEHGFSELNLHRVGCGTFSDNTGMVRLAAALGFRHEGQRRQAAFKHGTYLDLVEFGLLAEEWRRRAAPEPG